MLAEEVAATSAPRFYLEEYAGDWDLVRFPIVLRRVRTADSIAPLGLGGHHKTVNRYFKDAKVPLDVRRRAWVLADQRTDPLGCRTCRLRR